MSTFGDIKTIVLRSLGREDDIAIDVTKNAINYAILMASLIFDPPEMSRTSDVVIPGGSNSLTFPNIVEDVDLTPDDFLGMFEIDDDGDLMPIAGETLSTRLLDLIKVYNKTSGFKLNFIPYEQWDVLIPSSLTVIKYWTLFGNTLRINYTPTSNLTLTISYTIYPEVLTDDSEVLPFNYHDSYIVSAATGIAFAMFEETDSSSMWSTIAGFVGEPKALGARARAIIEGQKVLLEKLAFKAKGEA
jgi:hypothetical protein